MQFDAENRDEMYEKIWALESLLHDNNYRLDEHHTIETDKMRSVRYGRVNLE